MMRGRGMALCVVEEWHDAWWRRGSARTVEWGRWDCLFRTIGRIC